MNTQLDFQMFNKKKILMIVSKSTKTNVTRVILVIQTKKKHGWIIHGNFDLY